MIAFRCELWCTGCGAHFAIGAPTESVAELPRLAVSLAECAAKSGWAITPDKGHFCPACQVQRQALPTIEDACRGCGCSDQTSSPGGDLLVCQRWRCDLCGAHGDALHTPNASSLEVMDFIAERHAIQAGDCHIVRGVDKVRLGVREVVV